MEMIEDQTKKIEAQFKKRDEAVMLKYKEDFNIQIDRVRKKNGFYIVVANKKEAPFPEESIKVFLEATWEL